MTTGNLQKQYDDAYREKAQDLLSGMSLEEKVLQMVHAAAAIERLDIPAYNWWNEALHGVARAGVATVFPQAIGLAAMFNPDFLEEIADTIATEGRAKHEAAARHGDRDIYKGLTFWSPNINIFRDPRWGRGHETYGEDPYLTAVLGQAFIEGLQGKDPRYLKAAACAKHYAVHSGPEGLRHEFDAVVDEKDLWETYLYAFEACVVDAKVESVMGAYNRVNGDAACAHPRLLQDILRGQWQFDGHVVSDCWAIRDLHENHKITRDASESAALSVKCGCDLNCGQAYLHLLAAIDDGLIDEGTIDRSVLRLLTARFRLGLLGDAADLPYRNVPLKAIDHPDHRRQNLEAARQSLVLLKNDGILPLRRDKVETLAVIGPNADSREALLGNYFGTPSNPKTPLAAFCDELEPERRVLYAQGCHLYQESDTGLSQPGDRLAEAVACAKEADAVVLCLGLDAMLEGEEGDTGNQYAAGDKPDLSLPGLQTRLLREVLAVGRPVILVVLAGSALAIPESEKAAAIVQAWYPGALGGQALAQLVFGDYSPSGRLPLTFYHSHESLPDFTDYDMAGRTYRYLKEEPLYPFGYGLSYTTFEYEPLTVTPLSGGDPDDRDTPFVKIEGRVKNSGDRAGRECVQLYLRHPRDDAFAPQPHHQLRGLASIHLEPGQAQDFSFVLQQKHLWQIDCEHKRRVGPGRYQVFVGGSQPDAQSVRLTQKKPVEASFDL